MSAKTKPKVDRRPYASALDMRDALLDFHKALAEVDRAKEFGVLRLHFGCKDVRVMSANVIASNSWEITALAERLRAAAKRVMVAEYGLQGARRFVGWRRPRAT